MEQPKLSKSGKGRRLEDGAPDSTVQRSRFTLKYCVSSISIALVHTPGASGNHPKGEECTKATPPPFWEGADLVKNQPFADL